MAIEFPKLPYPQNALAPSISKKTIQFHYGKHHRKYVDQLNSLIAGTSLDLLDLEEIMFKTHGTNVPVFNNAAQAWNHDFYWHGLTPKACRPSRGLVSTINKNFNSVNDFKKEFFSASMDLFGSGWTWLVKDSWGRLHIRALPNAENPLLAGEVPLLTCDLWEHAYYLDWKSERKKYLENFWTLIDWTFIESNLDQPLLHLSSRERNSREIHFLQAVQ